jgi:CheY-like chemotaxis protein
MAHSLPYPQPPEPPLPPPRSINASRKSALLVESDPSLLILLRTSLKNEGYAVRTAANSEEGLRLYRDFRPFNVVLINYYLPPRDGFKIDCLAPVQTHGTALATAIRDIDRSQRMIIAALDYRDAEGVIRPPELMNIPLLIDISNFQLRGLLEKIEVDRAIEALTCSELVRLQKFADFRVRGLGRAARCRAGADLLGEAVLRTLIGAEDTQRGRHWKEGIDFELHLKETMRSISDSWRRQFKVAVQRKEPEAYLIPALPVYDAEGQEHSPLEDVSQEKSLTFSAPAPAYQRLIEKDEEDRVLTIFKDEPEATQVLQGLLDGLKKNEIMSRYGLGEKQYAAVVKRILKLLGRGNGGSKG